MRYIKYLILFIGFIQPLYAQSITSIAENAQTEASPATPVKIEIPESLKSARATFLSFQKSFQAVRSGKSRAIDQAVATLDLSDINKLVRIERGQDLSWILHDIIDRTAIVNPEKISSDPDAKEPWIFKTFESGDIRISRKSDGRWLFSKDTIKALPEIHKEVIERSKVAGLSPDVDLPWQHRLQAALPEILQRQSLLIQNWKWIGLFLLILLGIIADKFVCLIFSGLFRLFRKSKSPDLKAISDESMRPFGILAMASVWWAGLGLLILPEGALLILSVAVKFLAGVAIVLVAWRLIDVFGLYLTRKSLKTKTQIDDALVALVPKTLKVFVSVIGLIFIAQSLNLDVTGLLAGLGLGGLAFALAAKDIVQNFFGSIMVLFDRTFRIGDWIVTGEIEGTVEEIGFRSTKVRTFYNSVISLPNSHFISADVDNMGKRRYRRYKSHFSIGYETPTEIIEAFCEGIREIVRQHPYMRKDYYHVYLNDMADSSLQVLIYVFWETPDWATELRERHRFLLDCIRLAQVLNVDFAYPTQNIYMRKDEDIQSKTQQIELGKAKELGKQKAKEIIEETTGLDVHPPPVIIS